MTIVKLEDLRIGVHYKIVKSPEDVSEQLKPGNSIFIDSNTTRVYGIDGIWHYKIYFTQPLLEFIKSKKIELQEFRPENEEEECETIEVKHKNMGFPVLTSMEARDGPERNTDYTEHQEPPKPFTGLSNYYQRDNAARVWAAMSRPTKG